MISSTVSGLMVTAAVGTAAYMMTHSPAAKRRKMRRTANQAMHTLSDMMETMAYMIKG
jgi:hypothetical protein